jgi:HD-like signal output (HDOD) protein
MGMVPDRALLAGLVHNIGAIPVLRYAADYPELSKNRTMINDLIERLGHKLGSLVLRQWSFDSELVDIPSLVNNHDYAPDQDVDYTDLVIVANMHSQFGKHDIERPVIEGIASFRKLPLFTIGPDASIELLYEAREEINSMTRMLVSAA